MSQDDDFPVTPEEDEAFIDLTQNAISKAFNALSETERRRIDLLVKILFNLQTAHDWHRVAFATDGRKRLAIVGGGEPLLRIVEYRGQWPDGDWFDDADRRVTPVLCKNCFPWEWK